MPLNLHACLLAGGRSERMGRDKATIEIAGTPLWRSRLDALLAVTPHTAISAPAPPAWLTPGLTFLADSPLANGPLAGLLAGLEWARAHSATHLLVLAVDLPLISPAFLSSLVASARPGVGVLYQTPNGYEPLCAIYPTEAEPPARHVAAAAHWKLQSLCDHLLSLGLLSLHQTSAEESQIFLNLNTPQDLPPSAANSG